ncbi:hypothetical protein PNIG_a2489 [Pseudoalteromonas nigrifaciens]|uniref:Uncharacterized protein n=1 Tax=Pseudoalteromonas nigrifaciens TaxID=28109 RepID=A0AAC9XY59_9GAMM|nr:hypothetical protein PNIG_a2489 [Pseudoalteromonas nigrifaciens]
MSCSFLICICCNNDSVTSNSNIYYQTEIYTNKTSSVCGG